MFTRGRIDRRGARRRHSTTYSLYSSSARFVRPVAMASRSVSCRFYSATIG